MSQHNHLQTESVGFWGLVSQSISGMAPTCDVVAFMTAGAAFALAALPLSYLLAFLVMFIEVNTIYHLSKHRTSAGGYYSYVAAGIGPKSAVFTAFMVIFYQIVSVAGIPVYIGGVFLPGILTQLHITLPPWFWIATVIFFIGVPLALGLAGIRPTIRFIALSSLIEIVFLIISSILIIVHVHPSAPFVPFEIPNRGIQGVALGMIFGITSFIGVGSHTPLGEEAKNRRNNRGRIVGRAALISLSLVGAALTLSAYALTVGWGIQNMATFATNGAPGVVVFEHYLGPVGAIVLVILALNSALADGIALITSSARILYAIGRDELMHASFAQVNGRSAPRIAVILLSLLAFTIAIVSGLLLGPSNAFNMLTTAVLFGLVAAHTLLNISVMRLYHKLKTLHLIRHFVLPILSTLILFIVLYYSIWPPVYPLWISPLVFLAVGISVNWYILRLRRKKPDKLKIADGLPHHMENLMDEFA
ncbi:APC family permease [Alicyclobacillus sp. TC]|uniref:APC family permease n=1 Tax=Alicyclobacillus sp. TC TaxID=2606450 RepID=UPI001933973B|nr:APC family permease [Alicyclobacillus sp. TC]QRF23870.1 APC family permease [Alicyclobacillus sp. TC]